MTNTSSENNLAAAGGGGAGGGGVPRRRGGGSTNTTTSATANASGSGLAVVLSRFKSPAGGGGDPTCRQFVRCSAWRGVTTTTTTTTSSNAAADDSKSNDSRRDSTANNSRTATTHRNHRLEYYTFVDRPDRMDYLVGLIRREAERTSSSTASSSNERRQQQQQQQHRRPSLTVHVACAVPDPASKKKKMRGNPGGGGFGETSPLVRGVLDVLERRLNGAGDGGGGGAEGGGGGAEGGDGAGDDFVEVCYDPGATNSSLDPNFDLLVGAGGAGGDGGIIGPSSLRSKNVTWVLSGCDPPVKQALHFLYQKEESHWFQQDREDGGGMADGSDDDCDASANSSTVTVVPGDVPGILSYDAAAADCLFVWPPSAESKSPSSGAPSNSTGGGAGDSAAGSSGSAAATSLYSLFDVSTASGRRCLSVHLLQPSTSLPEIRERQRCVETLLAQWSAAQTIRSQLGAFGGSSASNDVLALATRLEEYGGGGGGGGGGDPGGEGESGGNLGGTRKALQALYQLYVVASQKLPALVEALEQLQIEEGAESLSDGGGNGNGLQKQPSLLQSISASCNEACHNLHRSVELAEAVLDLDEAPREFLIQKSYLAELTDISSELEQVKVELDELHSDMNQLWAQASGCDASTQAVRLEQTSSASSGGGNESSAAGAGGGGGATWQFRLANTNDSKLLQSQLGSIVTVHRVLKNGVYFTTKDLRQLSCKHLDLLAEYQRHQLAVVKQCLPVAATYAPILLELNNKIGELDVLLAMTSCAAHRNYCRPTLTDVDPSSSTAAGNNDNCSQQQQQQQQRGEEHVGHGVVLREARHPCVELQEAVEYIPNDMDLLFGESSFLLVTGPNMGGKSTYLRALGAIVLLAQIGSYVPCSSAKLNLCHHILARVGAGDMQDRGISTFFAEMLESSAILQRATNRSLLLIDELGRGTSTFDGYGLARAISEYIVQRIQCLAVFTTHFHELTALEDHLGVVKNCHVTAKRQAQGLTFLYQVRDGPCLESFGIQVAEMASVPAVVVQDAKIKAKELENFEYRKRSDTDAAGGGGATASTSDDQDGDERAFVEAFSRIPLESILNSVNASDEARRAALMQALSSS